MQVFLIKNKFRGSQVYIVAENIIKAINIYKQEALKQCPDDFEENEITEVENLGFCFMEN